MQNPSDEDSVVYVEVENVEVRISDESTPDSGAVIPMVMVDGMLYLDTRLESTIDAWIFATEEVRQEL